MESSTSENALPLKEWDVMPIEGYKLVLAEMKEHFDSQISEVVSVTDKTTSYTIGFLSFLFGTSAFIFTKYSANNITWFLFFLSALNACYGTYIVKARKGYSAGLTADNILTADFNDPNFNEDEKDKLTLFNAIQAYQIKITGIIADNETRAKHYNYFLYITMTLVLLMAANVLYIIFDSRTSAGSSPVVLSVLFL